MALRRRATSAMLCLKASLLSASSTRSNLYSLIGGPLAYHGFSSVLSGSPKKRLTIFSVQPRPNSCDLFRNMVAVLKRLSPAKFMQNDNSQAQREGPAGH